MKKVTDGNGNFPLEEKSSSVAGSPPTADNFNGETIEVVNRVLEAGFPLDPMSGGAIGSDSKPMIESESNKQVLRAIQHLDQDTYLKSAADNNRLINNLIGRGIVQGLVATKTDLLVVTIADGFGYDGLGQQIIVTEPMIVDINSEASATEKTIPLALRYSIVPADYKIGDTTPNYKDTILITAVHGADVLGDDLMIADIVIDSTGITKITAPINLIDQRKIDTIDLVYPINSTYTQFPDKTTGLFREEDSPLALFGGDWEEVEKRIYNNVPTKVTNKFGYSEKYPHGLNKFVTNIDGFLQGIKVTFPVPFLDLPIITSEWVREVGTQTYNQIPNDDTCGVSQLTLIDYNTIVSTVAGYYYTTQQATGYWKQDNVPITPEEEKDYVIIWKKIAPPTI